MATFTVTTNTKTNSAPTVIGDNRILVDHGATHIFTIANFTTETYPAYSDPEGDAISKFKILAATYDSGSIELNGVAVSIGDEIDHTSISSGLLTYEDDGTNTASHESTIEYTLSDLGSNSFSSSSGNIGFKISAQTNSAPSQVGDGSETIGFGETLIFTRAMFTTSTTPSYLDPEGDVADKLKVTVLPSTGIIKLNGVNISANQEINFTDIDSGLLSFVGDLASLSGSSDSFEFEISDLGSGIFRG